MDEFIGVIKLFAGNFAPRGWAFCAGQLLSINQNTALFSIIGTTYGGNGTTTFALPDLRGRVPIGVGQGPGLSSCELGESGGVEHVTLMPSNIPVQMQSVKTPAEGNPTAISVVTGGSQPHSNMQPYLGLSYIICLYGIYPTRD